MKQNQAGFTFVELMVAILILLPVFALGLETFIKCVELSDMAKDSATATAGVRAKMAEIENAGNPYTNFSQIYSTYNNATFTISGLNGIGVIYVDNSNPSHDVVTISFSWKERDSRVIGEDQNLNGRLDSGEDTNGNHKLDSIVEVSTQIYNNSTDKGPDV